ncbi:hypothetical protein OYC64_002304 [Pagothenia borchgrevinki]|uniref:Uncharacterized protein n=1 Tax=Pagothenia borchgrevinki TaxID=8213 RepID=A0ABD2H7I9_PAGBO
MVYENIHEAFLKVKEGHFVTVKRNSIAGLVLCVVELKEEAPSVKIWTRVSGTKNLIAFSFPSTDGNYSPKVKEKTLQLEKIADVSEIDEPYWFEKVDLHANEHYGLRSVVNDHYLSKDDTKETSVFCLSEDSQACAELTDEA